MVYDLKFSIKDAKCNFCNNKAEYIEIFSGIFVSGWRLLCEEHKKMVRMGRLGN